MWTADP